MSITRRQFLSASALSTAGLLGAGFSIPRKPTHCIRLLLVGGPSQLDTWDPKPDAPSNVRGPYSTIPTKNPGVRFSSLFPRMAASSDRFTLIRSMNHSAPPIHEAGLQLLQTGRYSGEGISSVKSTVILPKPLSDLGSSSGTGQQTSLQVRLPDVANDPMRSHYGATSFGDDCLRAARLVEQGVRQVTVNMFTTVYDTITWDCHAASGSLPSTLADYAQLGTTFDLAFTALLEDLDQRGLLDSTLIVAGGEFGRTPLLNREGGRDHWAGAWSMLLAGAGTEKGRVIGHTDRLGGEVVDTPLTPADIYTLSAI
jgi:hypothetical protein